MKNIILFISILSFIGCSCNNNNNVRIQLDKEFVLIGEIVTARLYVNHDDSIAPIFYIVDNLDTVRLPLDDKDNNCGVFRARYSSIGEKEINGYADFLDKQSKRQTFYYTIKFKVEALPTIPPNLK